jgi:hypothetical protein
MVTSTTRSIHGATYVPIDWSNKEDPGWSEESNDNLKKFHPKNVYKKGAILGRVFKDGSKSMMVNKAFRQKFLSADSTLLSDETKELQSKVLDLAEQYSENRSYQELVSSPVLRDIDSEDLADFVKNYLDAEHELLGKALEDWKLSAEEEIKTEEEPEISEGVSKEIGKVRSEVDMHFRYLSSEIATLREKLTIGKAKIGGEIADLPEAARLLATPEAREARTISESHPEITGKTSKVSREAVTPTVMAIPKSKVWSRMWHNEKRRESAKFLGTYLFTGNKMADHLSAKVMAVTSMADRLEITDEQIGASVRVLYAGAYKSIYDMLEDLSIEPVGELLLERLDFTPMGYVKGELVYSLPLTPAEKITVSHREWSNTTEEYVKTVEEFFEEAKEKALSEKSELAESTRSEKQVEHQVEASFEASYGGGSWSVALGAGYSGNFNTQKAAERSSKRNQEITSKAASRSKKEHKMSFKVAREVHVEDEQVRVIENKSDQPVRWDFHRLMQKWKIQLYHLDIRLTYDLVIPEPADYLLRKYIELKNIQEQIDSGNPFMQKFIDEYGGNISDLGYGDFITIGLPYGVEPEPKPPWLLKDSFSGTVDFPAKTTSGSSVIEIEFPDGYWISEIEVTEPINTDSIGDHYYNSSEVAENLSGYKQIKYHCHDTKNRNRLEKKVGETRILRNKFSWYWSYYFNKEGDWKSPTVRLDATATRKYETLAEWQMKCFSKIKEAAHAKWITDLEGLQNKRDRLIEELIGKDGLKLRQMEREEIMKGVLRWMLGPDFEFYPEGLAETLTSESEEELGLNKLGYYDDETGQLNEEAREGMLQHGEIVRFLQQAIEWENINWIMYPYFWTRPDRWDFKQSLDHPDFYHRNFLRGGCARVVLTIRPGFVEDWMKLMEGTDSLPDDHPYLRLAEEIKNMANTQYAYTLNPNRDELIEKGTLKDTWYEYTPTGALDIKEGEELLER